LGFCSAVLIAICFVIQSLPVSAALLNRCTSCHAVHYRERGSCDYCHRGDQRTSRKELAHTGLIAGRFASFTDPLSPAVIAGNKIAERSACRRCHLFGKKGNNLATNLDNLLWTAPPEYIRSALLEPALYMPVFHFSDRDIEPLITAILSNGLRTGKLKKESPQVVHFSNTSPEQNIFVKQCGGCHKMLSKKDGGVGVGITGPNLSGLLGVYYPATFDINKIWNRERLRRWLKNPRSIREHTLMRPVALNPEEWGQLLLVFEFPGQN